MNHNATGHGKVVSHVDGPSGDQDRGEAENCTFPNGKTWRSCEGLSLEMLAWYVLASSHRHFLRKTTRMRSARSGIYMYTECHDLIPGRFPRVLQTWFPWPATPGPVGRWKQTGDEQELGREVGGTVYREVETTLCEDISKACSGKITSGAKPIALRIRFLLILAISNRAPAARARAELAISWREKMSGL